MNRDNSFNITFTGEVSVMRDHLAGGGFYTIEIDGEDLLEGIEDALTFKTDRRTSLGRVKVSIDFFDEDKWPKESE